MENIRIASTPLAGLRPVGQVTSRDHNRLSAQLASLAAGTPELRVLFADSEPTRDGTRIDWYSPADSTYVPLTSMPEADRAAVLDKVDELSAAVRLAGERLSASGDPFGEALVNATSLPGPREKYIYVGRSPSDPRQWHPVVVCWAYANDVPATAGLSPQIMKRRPFLSRGGKSSDAAAQGAVLASAPAMAIAGRRTAWWLLLWIALLLLLLAMAWLMLRACGMAVPGLGRAFCPVTTAAASTGDEERNRALNELARQLELQIAQREVTCLTERHAELQRQSVPEPTPTPTPTPTPQPQPKPEPEPKKAETPTLDERLKREGAKSGELQISLVWDGPADLDLHVYCPNGERIYYSKKSGCGGTLDVDMNNSENKSTSPVENAFWPDGAPQPGRYRISVVLYDRHGDNRQPIPFQVRIKMGSDQRTVPGTITKSQEPVEVTEFTK